MEIPKAKTSGLKSFEVPMIKEEMLTYLEKYKNDREFMDAMKNLEIGSNYTTLKAKFEEKEEYTFKGTKRDLATLTSLAKKMNQLNNPKEFRSENLGSSPWPRTKSRELERPAR